MYCLHGTCFCTIIFVHMKVLNESIPQNILKASVFSSKISLQIFLPIILFFYLLTRAINGTTWLFYLVKE